MVVVVVVVVVLVVVVVVVVVVVADTPCPPCSPRVMDSSLKVALRVTLPSSLPPFEEGAAQ